MDQQAQAQVIGRLGHHQQGALLEILHDILQPRQGRARSTSNKVDADTIIEHLYFAEAAEVFGQVFKFIITQVIVFAIDRHRCGGFRSGNKIN